MQRVDFDLRRRARPVAGMRAGTTSLLELWVSARDFAQSPLIIQTGIEASLEMTLQSRSEIWKTLPRF